MVFEKYSVDIWRIDNKDNRIGTLIKIFEDKTSSEIEKRLICQHTQQTCREFSL